MLDVEAATELEADHNDTSKTALNDRLANVLFSRKLSAQQVNSEQSLARSLDIDHIELSDEVLQAADHVQLSDEVLKTVETETAEAKLIIDPSKMLEQPHGGNESFLNHMSLVQGLDNPLAPANQLTLPSETGSVAVTSEVGSIADHDEVSDVQADLAQQHVMTAETHAQLALCRDRFRLVHLNLMALKEMPLPNINALKKSSSLVLTKA